MIFLLRYWQAFAGLLAGLAIAYVLHSFHVSYLEAQFERELAAQQAKLVEQCNADKNLTYEASRDYQSKIRDLTARVKRLQSNSRTVPIANPSGGFNGSSASNEHGGQNGVTTYDLYEYAGEAEQYRIQVAACQQFIRKTWEARGYALP